MKIQMVVSANEVKEGAKANMEYAKTLQHEGLAKAANTAVLLVQGAKPVVAPLGKNSQVIFTPDNEGGATVTYELNDEKMISFFKWQARHAEEIGSLLGVIAAGFQYVDTIIGEFKAVINKHEALRAAAVFVKEHGLNLINSFKKEV